jgi:hypothetical protein
LKEGTTVVFQEEYGRLVLEPDEHFGTDSGQLSQTVKPHIRLNQNHSATVFRVRVDGLLPRTMYYYTVDSSMQASRKSDGVKSSVYHFASP